MLVALALALPGALAAVSPPFLELSVDPDRRPLLSAPASTNDVVILERTTHLTPPAWEEWLRAQGPIERQADLATESSDAGFYRALVRPRGTADDWKNVVQGEAGESFQSEAPPDWSPGIRWIKFALMLDAPGRVVFQDSSRYEFHYDFAVKRLPEFAGLNRAAFDAVTLHTNGQRAVLGAVLFPPSPNVRELGIQFVGLDAYPREAIADWYRTVRSRIQVPAGISVFYLPTFEQASVARQHRDWLESRQVPVSGTGRWVLGDECYSPGWALGRLVFVPGTNITTAYRSGALRPDDVLLTDAVPAEVPPLAGIVTLQPSTPNSHVALLSQSFGIPFVYLADDALAGSVTGWTNRDVMVRAVQQFAGCELSVAPLDGPLPEDARTNILALRVPAPLKLTPKTPSGRISLPADGLRPKDVAFVGGKAANFGVLRRQLPDRSPAPALALTFDLWDAFLDQPHGDGRTLRQAIRDRLGTFAWPPDMASLQTALDEVRHWITDDSDFTAAQKAELVELLRQAGFDPGRNIRFRSSTNVEDSDAFSGAGLQDSYSGCLADDQDVDDAGPSACDPTETKERGVFRALRKVYASFYNDNAFLERLRHRVDEAIVGMGILVHHSVPDALELANGVATMRITKDGVRYLSGELVTQAGAVSVTNPDSTAVPETVSFSQFGASVDLSIAQHSSLVPLGDSVMTWPTDYRALLSLLNLGAQGYEAEFPAKKALTLDFEYKRLAPDGRLQVKQVREVPRMADTSYVPWLLNVADTFDVEQGEFGDAIAKHRLKSTWQFAVRTLRLRDAELTNSPLVRLETTGRLGTQEVVQAGPIGQLPDYRFTRNTDDLIDRWSHGTGASQRRFELRISRLGETSSATSPLLVLADHPMGLRVTYTTPQPGLEYDPGSDSVRGTLVTNDDVRLRPVRRPDATSLRQDRSFKAGRATFHTEFWWPAPPKGPTAGYTAPLQAWIGTTVTGLTSRPLVLRQPSAQTYHPGHHNFVEAYVFEPRLDPEVPPDLLAELVAANIKAVVVSDPRGNFGQVTALIWGFDDQFRPL